MLVELTFRRNGLIAELTNPANGLLVAKMLVHGPFERNAQAVARNYDECFVSELRGIGDDEYVNEKLGVVSKISR